MNEDLNRQVVISLLKSGNQFYDEINLLVKKFGLTLPQFNVLRILRGRNNEPTNLTTINEHMIHKMSNTTRIIDKLISKGYVNRKICKNNRRKIELTITQQGLTLLKKIDQPLNDKEADLVKNISDEEKNIIIQTLSNFH